MGQAKQRKAEIDALKAGTVRSFDSPAQMDNYFSRQWVEEMKFFDEQATNNVPLDFIKSPDFEKTVGIRGRKFRVLFYDDISLNRPVAQSVPSAIQVIDAKSGLSIILKPSRLHPNATTDYLGSTVPVKHAYEHLAASALLTMGGWFLDAVLKQALDNSGHRGFFQIVN